MLSPGPGRPADFDCDKLLSALDERGLPAFGVCLGLQAMVEHAGGSLGLLDTPVHGKPGRVQVLGGALLAGLPAEFTAARYHSLHARPEQVTGGFEVTAVTADGVVMAIEDAARGAVGRAVPPGVDPDHGGRRRTPDHRQRAAVVPTLIINRRSYGFVLSSRANGEIRDIGYWPAKETPMLPEVRQAAPRVAES